MVPDAPVRTDILTISALGELTGVSPDTLRYYGKLNLLSEAGRTPAGHRYYDPAAVERVRFIKSAQWFDLSLEEISELLSALDAENCPCGATDTVLRERIAAIDQQRDALGELRGVLCRVLTENRAEGFRGEEASTGAAPPQGAIFVPEPQSEVDELRARLEAVEASLTTYLTRDRARRTLGQGTGPGSSSYGRQDGLRGRATNPSK